MTTAHARGVIPQPNGPQRLVLAREHIGLNQGEMAQLLGVSTGTVQRAESGKTMPRRTTFIAWAFATGVDQHWLETGHAPSPDGDGACMGCAIRDSNPEPADKSDAQVKATVTPLRRRPAAPVHPERIPA